MRSVYGIKCLIAPGVPNNHGSMLPFTIAAPQGSILNCVRPAPVAARHIVGHALPNVVLGCLHQAAEGGAPAEGSMMWNPYLRGARWFDGAPRAWEAPYFNSGGMGARPGLDGLSATAFPSGIRGIPVEVAEAVAPVLVWRKELRPDPAGPGRFRGGFGQVVEIGSTTGHGFAFQAMFDRVDNPAQGRDGGGSGTPGTVRLASGGTLRAKGLQSVPDGDRLVLEIPGGGGHGDPGQRDPARVAVVQRIVFIVRNEGMAEDIEAARGQVAITPADLEHVEQVVMHSDAVRCGGTARTKLRVAVPQKTIGNHIWMWKRAVT